MPSGAKQHKRRGSILFSLLILLFLVGVVPLLWTSRTLVTRTGELLELNQKATQLDKARSLSQQVAVYVASLKAHLTAVARTLEVEASLAPFADRVARMRDAKALERYVGGESRFYSFSIVDAAGHGPRSGAQLPEPAIEQMLQEGYLRGLEGHSMLGPPLFSPSLQEPVIVLSEPVKPGAVQGVVLAVASLGPLWEMTKQMGEAGLVEVYIVDSRGRLVAHSNPAKLQEDPDLSSVEIVRQFLESKGALAATVPFQMSGDKNVRKMLGTYTRVPDESGWGVIVQVDEQKAYYSAIQMRNQSIALVLLVTLLAIVLGTLFAGQISRPIQELALGARRLAGGDYDTRVSVASRNEVGVLAEAFNQMGAEIQTAIEEVRKQAEINKELFLGSIRMLANAIDEKDPYTRGHSERVAFYSAVIAKHMGMSPAEVERVHLSGIIHDVGKIGIEDKILRKPAALTDEEYEIMKQHPAKGLKILDAVPRLKEIAGGGLMHHENIDGSGYPDGLKGNAIPLLGRIVSVADAFDAMTTDRPYSKAMTFEAALSRLRLLAGKKFDSDCVSGIEKAHAAGELTMAKARKASLASRQQPQPLSPPPS